MPLYSEASVTSRSFFKSSRDLIAHWYGDRCVSIVAIEHNPAIDGNDVAGFQHPFFRRDAVNNLFVDRGAEHARIIVITLECRLRARVLNLLLCGALEIHGRDPGSDHRPQRIKHLTNDTATAPHLVNLFSRFTNDSHAF